MPAIGLIPVLVAGLSTQGAFTRVPGNAATPVGTAQQVAAGQPTAELTTASAAPTPAEPDSVGRTGSTSSTTSTGTSSSPSAATPPSTAAAQAATAASASAAQSASASGSADAPNATACASSSTPHAESTSQPFIAYRVQPGDTIRFIARAYGVSAASIAQASGLTNPDQLRVGQLLTIPAHPGWLYRVQPCETLDQIATRTGVPTDSIVSASGLTAASVGPGDVILIPDQSAQPTSK
jgi:LysM repeat protein